MQSDILEEKQCCKAPIKIKNKKIEKNTLRPKSEEQGGTPQHRHFPRGKHR
jgi:hypothetical protein